MKFTLIFTSHENNDLTLGCIFVPSLLWVRGQRKLLNPHPNVPLYQKSDFQGLLENTDVGSEINQSRKRMCLVVHEIGHGTSACLKLLKEDLLESGFEPKVVYL
jgi:hypothetical protein